MTIDKNITYDHINKDAIKAKNFRLFQFNTINIHQQSVKDEI